LKAARSSINKQHLAAASRSLCVLDGGEHVGQWVFGFDWRHYFVGRHRAQHSGGDCLLLSGAAVRSHSLSQKPRMVAVLKIMRPASTGIGSIESKP
jgi:hypothetical protein